jgi:hypothetical protein
VAELVNAYIDWQICEMSDLPIDNLDEIYPISPLPRVRFGFLNLVIDWGWAEFSNSWCKNTIPVSSFRH